MMPHVVIEWVRDPATGGPHCMRPVFADDYTRALERLILESGTADKQDLEDLKTSLALGFGQRETPAGS